MVTEMRESKLNYQIGMKSPLHLAAEKEHIFIVEELIKSGVDIDLKCPVKL